MRLFPLPTFLSLVAAVALHAQTVPLNPVVVTATRSEIGASRSPFSSRVFSSGDVRTSPALTLDSMLRSEPAFGLFRRSDSLAAHPTAQGVSLRGLGPSGASRSLVLLDGVPLNDPFGGWVNWSKLPRWSLDRAELVSGGGSSAWGNAALGGVIQLFSERPPDEPTAGVTLLGGDFRTASLEFSSWTPAGPGMLQVSGRAFSTDGYPVVAPESRGSVDVPVRSHHEWAGLRWVQQVSATTTATVSARLFRERRGNGTAYTRNGTAEASVSASVESRVSPEFRWSLTAYGQDEGFSSTFSSVNATRSTETPASNQHEVPARALGTAVIATWGAAEATQTVAGLETRRVRGETREHYSYSEGRFTRSRAAGGRQESVAAFALLSRPLGGSIRGVVGSRVDFWRDRGGFRRERELASGSVLRDEAYEEMDGVEWSPSAGLTGRWNEHFQWRLSGQQSFRRPTLNELYRPFRVGNVITETNAGLKTERARTLEGSVSAEVGAVSGELTAFRNELQDAVGNVTLVRGPGTFEGFGFVPAGGVGRRRENLDRVRVQGLEASLRWRWTPGFSLTADALVNDAKVRKARLAPGLEGKRVAQVPRTSASLGALWTYGRWSLSPRARWMGAQFEDDENALRLAPAWVVDVAVQVQLSQSTELFASLENAFNERVETGRSATNVINVGTPRFATGGVRLNW